MATIGTEDLSAMRAGFVRVLADKCTEVDVRRGMETESGHDSLLWRALSDTGVPGLLVPPAYGGVGAGPIELEALMEDAGEALLPGPLLPSVLAASMIALSTDEDARLRLLPPIASGSLIATVAWTGDCGSWTIRDVEVTATPFAEGWRLEGAASFVINANLADVLLVIARAPEGLRCFELQAGAEGVEVRSLRTWDRTVRLSRIRFEGAVARQIAGVAESAIQYGLDLACVALAAEQAGGARHIFEITVDYFKQRVQFGRPIGGFQALKHIVADLLVEVESATSAARAAARALAMGAPDRAALVALAAFTCADAFDEAAAAAVQLHGGVAFTWEHVAHLYLRRARAGVQLFGNSDAHRERFLSYKEQAA